MSDETRLTQLCPATDGWRIAIVWDDLAADRLETFVETIIAWGLDDEGRVHPVAVSDEDVDVINIEDPGYLATRVLAPSDELDREKLLATARQRHESRAARRHSGGIVDARGRQVMS